MEMGQLGSQDVAAEPFSRQGFALARSMLSPAECGDILLGLPADLDESAGSRDLLTLASCQSLASRLRSSLRDRLERDAVAIQCTYFAKSRVRNWLVPLHQDLSVPVAQHVEGAGLNGWSRKQGALFVQPPARLLERLVAVRLHLDPCAEDDGPLRVVPGSHRHGVLSTEAAAGIGRSHASVSCIAAAGDALLMRPLLLHASSKASGTSLRRVLHFLFAPAQASHGLRWQIAI
ncbi:MAG TPA: phytanoyl-CoA dioxygenase family protein [Ramlibacter sp.]|nr:phytanoyl-CoA dioxygenase family protein [Ramlibacter sp.]